MPGLGDRVASLAPRAHEQRQEDEAEGHQGADHHAYQRRQTHTVVPACEQRGIQMDGRELEYIHIARARTVIWALVT